MTLFITKRNMGPLSGVTYPPSALGLKPLHLVIASVKPEAVRIDIDEEIPDGSLKFLPMVSPDIKVAFETPATVHTMRHLADLFPAKSGTIRKTYQEGGDLRGLLSQVWWDKAQA